MFKEKPLVEVQKVVAQPGVIAALDIAVRKINEAVSHQLDDRFSFVDCLEATTGILYTLNRRVISLYARCLNRYNPQHGSVADIEMAFWAALHEAIHATAED